MIFEKVCEILVEALNCDPDAVTMDSRVMQDLQADSLDVVDIAMSLEDEFGVEIPDEDLEKVQTVGDIVRYLEENID